MRTEAERIEILHRRAKELERRRNERQMAGLGSVSAFLAVLLIFIVGRTSRMSPGLAGDPFTGSSLLSESTGGYVLAAVIAFFLGVVITAVCIKIRQKKEERYRRGSGNQKP